MNRTALLAAAIVLTTGCQAPQESLPPEAVASITKAAAEWDACVAPLEVLLNVEANRALGTAVETFIDLDTVSANGPTERADDPSGGSIAITSAPRSARIWPANMPR